MENCANDKKPDMAKLHESSSVFLTPDSEGPSH